MIKLTAGQQIKTPYDKFSPVIKVSTTTAFSKDGTHIGPEGLWVEQKIPFHLEGWKIWEASCDRDWRTQYAWSNQSSACLTADYPGKAAEMERKVQAYKDAVMVDDGDIVEIEGFQFEVRCIKRSVSDPVHFFMING